MAHNAADKCAQELRKFEECQRLRPDLFPVFDLLLQPDPPAADIELGFRGIWHGVDITALTLEASREHDALRRYVLERVAAQAFQAVPQLRAVITFAAGERPSANPEAVQALKQHLIAQTECPQMNRPVPDELRRFITGTRAWRDHTLTQPKLSSGGSFHVPVACDATVEQIIDCKAARIHHYRQEGRVSAVTLLICCSMSPSIAQVAIPASVKDWAFDHPSHRVIRRVQDSFEGTYVF